MTIKKIIEKMEKKNDERMKKEKMQTERMLY